MSAWSRSAPKVSRPPQAGDHREEVGGSPTVGWWPDHQSQAQDAAPPAARQDGGWKFQEARLEVLPAEDRSLPHRAIPELDEEPAHRSMLVVPVQDANTGALPQGVLGVEGAAEDLVGGGQERDREGEEPLEDPGSASGREMQQGGTRLPIHHGCRKAGPGPG